MDLLPRIEEHIAVNHITATQFGRLALHDPRFVFDLRSGRRLRPATAAKVEAYLGLTQLSLQFQWQASHTAWANETPAGASPTDHLR